MWQRIRHRLLGCDRRVIGFSILGAPIKHCAFCDRFWVTYGYGSYDHEVTPTEAADVWGSSISQSA